jgi:DNA repair protein RecO (recombination protein O)
MEWRDEGFVIGVRRHGESSAIVEAMTCAHGRHLGLVRNGQSRRMAATLQPGAEVALSWRARLEAGLGAFAIELLRSRSEITLGPAAGLHGLNWLCALLRLLPEREPYPALHEAACVLADHLTHVEVARPLMARFELAVLSELGFGLALESCAVTGGTQELTYVSPKSGRAVCRAAGEAWADRLFALPAFLRGGAGVTILPGEAEAALRLTAHFLERDVFAPRGLTLPDARRAFAGA